MIHDKLCLITGSSTHLKDLKYDNLTKFFEGFGELCGNMKAYVFFDVTCYFFAFHRCSFFCPSFTSVQVI